MCGQIRRWWSIVHSTMSIRYDTAGVVMVPVRWRRRVLVTPAIISSSLTVLQVLQLTLLTTAPCAQVNVITGLSQCIQCAGFNVVPVTVC